MVTLGWIQFTKWRNSVKPVEGVMLIVLFTFSNNASYLYHVSESLNEQDLHTEISQKVMIL